MATVKRILDLKPYATVLPYASELFGVYQPLLGWKSQRIAARFAQGHQNDRRAILDNLTRQFAGQVEVAYRDNNQVDIKVNEGLLAAGTLRAYDSVVLQAVSTALKPYADYQPSDWANVITADRIAQILKTDVVKAYATAYPEMRRADAAPILLRSRSVAPRDGAPSSLGKAAFEKQLGYESAIAGALRYMVQNKAHEALEQIFYASRDRTERARTMLRVLSGDGSNGTAYLDLSNMDPQDLAQIQSVVLSPIGVVHLFRQYFFELDSFLGTPEKHVWLSPGSSVELIEVHTRRTIVEKTLETALEVTTASEQTTTQQDEISDAVKEDNSQDVKFGASVEAKYASVTATSSFDYATSQKEARETTHKRMRQQTEKLSTQIRRNFKSTFKTTTDVTDVSSTRHVLANTTDKLINYELRRKMRQVGVQVQDIGTFLCWQCYVDDPGRDLGLAKLVHIAKPAELDSIPHPEELQLLQPFTEDKAVTIPFVSSDGTDADNEGEQYDQGVEVDRDDFLWINGDTEKIQWIFAQTAHAPKVDYELTSVSCNVGNASATISITDLVPNGDSATYNLRLEHVDFKGQPSIEVTVTLYWSPTKAANDAIKQKNSDNQDAWKARERAEYEKAYVEGVRDRVTLASKMQTRNSEDLRDEERIVVYRRLIQDMLMQGVPLPDDRTRHAVAEVLDSIFDIDKMLYFVAPEWWRPRLHRSHQQLPEQNDPSTDPSSAVGDVVVQRGLRKWWQGLFSNAQPSLLESSTVGWGGLTDEMRDNYFITDESEPARFGSSLGWLLQLDGDNMRNAFLNAPWVKAVIPIRPGREEAAINWLKGVEGMNGITDDVIYHPSNPEERDLNGDLTDGQKMIDVLVNLGRKVKEKYENGMKNGSYPKADDVSDPALVDDENTVTSTPIDRVYEHGFFPLKGGFRSNVGEDDYEIFDQWTEVLPTDQIVPVEVAYDPKTGRQL